MAGKIDFSTYSAKFEFDLSGVKKGFSEIDKNIKNTLSKSLDNIGGQMEKAGKSLSKVAIPLAGLGVAALKVGSDFQAGMSEVQAISGATGDDLDRLTEKAKELGATTKFSASESAEALKYMSMAGWDTNQMLDGLDGVMSLAAASGEDLGLVSDIVTDALTGFGMQAKDAGNFADLLASASSNSNTNVAMMGETFKYVAPLFGAMGYSAEDAALATGLLANAGIKGGQAGTVLRSSITNLINPTDKMKESMEKLGISMTDSNNEMLPFSEVMTQLREKFANLTEEQQAQEAATIFGKEAMSGMLAIINSSEEDFSKLTDATRDYNGVAKEMADVMEDNLQGQMTKLKSALEGVGIQIFEILLPIFSNLVDKLQDVVEWFGNLNPKTQEVIVQIGLLTVVIAPALIIIGKLVAGVGSAITAFTTISTAVAGAGGAIALLTGPIGIAIASITAIIASGVLLYKNWDTVKEKAGQLKDNISQNWDNMKTKISDTWDNVKTKTSDTWGFIKNKVDEHGGGIKGVIGTYMEGYKSVWSAGFKTMDEVTGGKLSEMASKVKDRMSAIKDSIVDSITSSARSWSSNVSNMVSDAQSKFSSIASSVASSFDRVKSAISSGIDKIRDWNNQRVENKEASFSSSGGNTTRYERGTNFVPSDQLAFLHKGEAVIPAHLNQQGKPYQGGQGIGNSGSNDTYEVKIEVKGNMDRSILPEVEKMITKGINKAQESKISKYKDVGIRRPVY